MLQFKSRHPDAGRLAACVAGLAFTISALAAQPPRIERDGLVYDGVPAPDAELIARIARYQQSRATRLLDWLPDGSMLVALPRGGGAEQLFRVGGPMRAPEPLSEADGAVGEAAGKAFDAGGIVLTRTGAGGITRLNLLDAGTHHEQPLPTAGVWPSRPLWAHDGRRLVYRAFDPAVGVGAQLYSLDTAGGEAQRISSGDDWRALDWSRDDKILLVMRQSAGHAAELMRLDAATLQATAITMRAEPRPARGRGAPDTEAWSIRQARFSSDGRSVLVLAARSAQPARLWRQSLDGSEPATALSAELLHEVEYFDRSADGRYIAFSYNDNGYSRVVVVDLRTSSERMVFALPSGTVNALKFDRPGAQLAINVEGPNLPAEVHVLDLASNALVRWTQAELGPLAVGELAVPSAVRVPTWQGEAARLPPALVYRPAAPAGAARRLPVLITLPESGASPRARYDAGAQALVNALGCVLIVPGLSGNVSTAEGRDYALRDIASLLVWIGLQPDFDRDRIAIEGTAASAPVALSALAMFADRLRGGIVNDNASVTTPVQVIERPVLLMRGASATPAPFGLMEQLMVRLRVGGNDTWVLATNINQPGTMNRVQALEAMRVRAQFLRDLYAGRATSRPRSD